MQDEGQDSFSESLQTLCALGVKKLKLFQAHIISAEYWQISSKYIVLVQTFCPVVSASNVKKWGLKTEHSALIINLLSLVEPLTAGTVYLLRPFQQKA